MPLEQESRVTLNFLQEYNVGIKCATITPDEARVREFGLKQVCVIMYNDVACVLELGLLQVCACALGTP